MIPRRRLLSKKSKPQKDEPHTASDQPALAELAEGLTREIAELSMEIQTLKLERSRLFRDIHYIMASKGRDSEHAFIATSDPLSPIPPRPITGTWEAWIPTDDPEPFEPPMQLPVPGPRSRSSSFHDETYRPPGISTAWRRVNAPAPAGTTSDFVPRSRAASLNDNPIRRSVVYPSWPSITAQSTIPVYKGGASLTARAGEPMPRVEEARRGALPRTAWRRVDRKVEAEAKARGPWALAVLG